MQLPWIKRNDLISTPHDTGGWVVKDPLTLHYTLLDDVEYRVLNLLDGRLSFSALSAAVQKLCPEQSLTPDDIAAFIGLLAGHQLIRRTGIGDSIRLNPTNTAPAWRRVLGLLLGMLRLQLPLVNPSRFLDQILPYVSWIYTRAAITVISLIGCVATFIVVTQFQTLQRALPTVEEFFGASNLILMLVTFVVIKSLHELGHAVTARYYGAECNECGVMLMVFTPVLYTNVSDAWLLPRRQRLLVTAAGILVELSIAAVAATLWWFATPGLTKSLLLNMMLICSVNTVIFNGNPLLRFDGYFLLTDAMRIPNLASRSGAVVQQTVLWLFTGHRQLSGEEKTSRRFLLVYGVSSAAYRLLLTLAILQLVQEMTARWQVEFIGTFMSAVMLCGFILMPLMKFGNELLNTIFSASPQDEPHLPSSWLRPTLCIAGLITVSLIPLPQSILAPAYVQPAGAAVYALLPGQLTTNVDYGDSVQMGDVIAEVRNRDLEKTQLKLAARVSELQLQIDSLQNNPLTATSASLPALQQAYLSASNQLDEFAAEMTHRTIKSPVDGVFLPPTVTPPSVNRDLPQQWHGLPVASINKGAWIDRGVLLGYVGATTDVTVSVCVEETDINFIQPNSHAEFHAAGTDCTIEGTVIDISHLASLDLPRAFATAGLVSGRPTETGFRPSTVSYLATVQLQRESISPPAIYSTGSVRIAAKPASLVGRLLRYLRRTFG